MPAKDEIIRPANRADIAGLQTLFFEAFEQNRDPALWNWKYFDNPRGTFSFVCEAGDRLVAHCGGTAIIVRDQAGRTFTALQSVDFMASPKHAGGLGAGGVFSRMVRAFFAAYCGAEAVPLVYGFPGERHRALGERILGYKPIEPVGDLLLLARSDKRAPKRPIDMAKLALLSQESLEFAGVRDEVYLRWRYGAHPLFAYTGVEVEGLSSRPLFAIIRETAEEILLMELEGDHSVRNVSAMAEKLASFGKSVRGWGSRVHVRSRALQNAGFEWKSRDHRLECRYFDEHPTPREGEFYYSLGDYDVF